MQSEGLLNSWKVNLAAFGRRNNLRPTRIEVLDRAAGVESDFWIEDGMLLSGIDVEADRNLGLSVDIMLQTKVEGSCNHLTHRIGRVKRLDLGRLTDKSEVLEIEDAAGTVTIVRFEC